MYNPRRSLFSEEMPSSSSSSSSSDEEDRTSTHSTEQSIFTELYKESGLQSFSSSSSSSDEEDTLFPSESQSIFSGPYEERRQEIGDAMLFPPTNQPIFSEPYQERELVSYEEEEEEEEEERPLFQPEKRSVFDQPLGPESVLKEIEEQTSLFSDPSPLFTRTSEEEEEEMSYPVMKEAPPVFTSPMPLIARAPGEVAFFPSVPTPHEERAWVLQQEEKDNEFVDLVVDEEGASDVETKEDVLYLFENLPKRTLLNILSQTVNRQHRSKLHAYADTLDDFVAILYLLDRKTQKRLSNVRDVLYALNPAFGSWDGLVSYIHKNCMSGEIVSWRCVAQLFRTHLPRKVDVIWPADDVEMPRMMITKSEYFGNSAEQNRMLPHIVDTIVVREMSISSVNQNRDNSIAIVLDELSRFPNISRVYFVPADPDNISPRSRSTTMSDILDAIRSKDVQLASTTLGLANLLDRNYLARKAMQVTQLVVDFKEKSSFSNPVAHSFGNPFWIIDFHLEPKDDQILPNLDTIIFTGERMRQKYVVSIHSMPYTIREVVVVDNEVEIDEYLMRKWMKEMVRFSKINYL